VNYSRSTARERKFLKRNEPLVLVGFGKYSLVDLMKFSETDPEGVIEAPGRGGIPRWRRVSVCTEEEISIFREYASWMAEVFQVKQEEL